ncbi:hypothetical protein [Curtobacterium sp. L1-20]|uniref:hypothetical protein n=1 Tax=Curtobacterium sp. L1-20 TaxID=3138181 RepID=UPI003B524710
MDPEPAGDHGRPGLWRNPLTDGWEYRWNVLVALPGRSPESVDAVLASVDAAQANTVVQVTETTGALRTPATRNLVHAAAPLPDLLDGMDVAVVTGDAFVALAAAQRRVPMVVLPADAAEQAVGDALAAVGAAVVVPSAAEVGDAVRAVASDGTTGPRIRELARRLTPVSVLLAVLGTSALRLVGRTVPSRRH